MRIFEKKSARIEVRVPPSIKKRLEALAEKEPDCSLSRVTMVVISHGLVVLEQRGKRK